MMSMSRGVSRRAEQGVTSLYLNVPKLCRDSQDVLFHSLHSKITVLSFNTIVVQVADRGEANSSCCLLYKTCNYVVKHQHRNKECI